MDEEKIKRFTDLTEQMHSIGGPFKYDGLVWPGIPGIYPDPKEKFKEICELECRDSDVFVCCFPKAGTNWAHEVLAMLITHSTRYNNITPGNGFLEIMACKDNLKNLKSPRLFVTHLPYRYLPLQLRNGTGRIVHLQRNPKDIHVSFYNFMKGKLALGHEMSWGEYFEKSVVGEDVMYGGWFTYSKEWETTFGSTNILPMYYEGMKKDLAGSVMKIAEFLNVPCTTEFAQEVGEKCSFENLKKNRIDFTLFFNSAGNTTLFRKGQVGDWKNWFTVAQNERYDELYKEQMKDSKLHFVYEL